MRAALFSDLEESGALRLSSSYSSLGVYQIGEV